MGPLNNFFARLFKGKYKSKKVDQLSRQIAAATSSEEGHVIPAVNIDSLLAASAAPEEISITPLKSDCNPSAWQVILWRPSILSVTLITPSALISRVQSTVPPFAGAATALAFGSSPNVAVRSLPIQGHLSSILFGPNSVENNITNQLLHASATITSTMRDDPSKVRVISQAATINSQQCQRSPIGFSPLPEPDCPEIRTSPHQHNVPNGDPTPRTRVRPTHAMPSLVWTPTTQVTSTLLGTPDAPGRPYYAVHNPNRFYKLDISPDRSVNVHVKAPQHPPGLGFPSGEETSNAPLNDNSILVPTIPNVRPAKCLPKPDLAPTPNARVPFPPLPPSPLELSGREPEVVHETVTIQPDPRYTYHATRTLGKGGNGTVWLGELNQGDGTGPMNVAIKVYSMKLVLARSLTGNTLRTIARNKRVPIKLLEDVENLRQVYEEEINIFECLTGDDASPFVAPLLHSFRSGNNFYLAMRYYPENLRQRARNKAYRLNRPQIRLIAAELVCQLCATHAILKQRGPNQSRF
ncbi:hypothetical protein BS17DRAFT_359483 [Gyrodon lividus]|nr:hypothetical protein BS17DRAFT_359483 [Gyrodon lividus]